MMMIYGFFVFSLHTLPYQNFQHDINWRHPSNSRVGQRPASQFIGVENETISLSGVLLPELSGGKWTLEYVKALAGQGKAYPLIEGFGNLMGWWVVESLSITKELFFKDGAARRYEFTLNLKRVDPPKGAIDTVYDLVDYL